MRLGSPVVEPFVFGRKYCAFTSIFSVCVQMNLNAIGTLAVLVVVVRPGLCGFEAKRKQANLCIIVVNELIGRFAAHRRNGRSKHGYIVISVYAACKARLRLTVFQLRVIPLVFLTCLRKITTLRCHHVYVRNDRFSLAQNKIIALRIFGRIDSDCRNFRLIVGANRSPRTRIVQIHIRAIRIIQIQIALS